MQMKKRVLSVLLALCLAGSLASTAWAAGDTAGATPSPAPVTQNLDENAGEPAELNENGEDLENTDLTDETLDDATDGAPDSDSTGVPEEGDTSDDSTAAGTSASDEEDSTSANEGDSTLAGDASSADGSTGAGDANDSTPADVYDSASDAESNTENDATDAEDTAPTVGDANRVAAYANSTKSSFQPASEGDTDFTLTWNRRRNGSIRNTVSVQVVLWDSKANKAISVEGNLDSYNATLDNSRSWTFSESSLPSIEGYTYQNVTYSQSQNFTEKLTSGGLFVEFDKIFSDYGTWKFYDSTSGKDNGIASNSLTLHVNYTPEEDGGTTPPSGGNTLTTTLGLDTKDLININVFDYETLYYATEWDPSLGINSGINSGHSLKFHGDTGVENDGQEKVNYDGSDPINKWTNNDSYNNNGHITYDGGVYQGIVNNTLTDGYPTLATHNGESLAYLFDLNELYEDQNQYKWVYDNANHLFTKDSKGYYTYDSSENFATLLKVNREQSETENDFALYSVPRSQNNGDNKVPSDHAQFLPFNELTGDLTNAAYTDYALVGGSESADHHFGMTVEFNFNMLNGGTVNGDPMIFSFSGDDDVWVFIDDVLVLDMGGIHNNYQGTIDFSTGDVSIERVWNNDIHDNNRQYTNTLEALFEAAGKTWNGEDLSTHTLKFFYLERGAGGSNCQLRFNIQPLPASDLMISKTANEYAPANQEYTFVLKDSNGNPVENKTYSVYEGSTTGDPVSNSNTTGQTGTITLKANQIAVFKDFYSETNGNIHNTYTVTEQTSGLSHLDSVVLSGGTSRDNQKHQITVGYRHSSVSFGNVFEPSEATLTITKIFQGLDADSIAEAKEKVSFQISDYDGPIDFGDPELDGNENYTMTATVTGLQYGVEYTVTETCTAPEGYAVESYVGEGTENKGTTATFTAGVNNAVTFTNVYVAPEEPQHQKYIKDNGDGTYDLTLNVTGSAQEQMGEKTKIDLIYVLDFSYSMQAKIDETNVDYYWRSGNYGRYRAVKQAVDALNEELSDERFDVRIATVKFWGSSEIVGNGSWWMTIDQFDNNSVLPALTQDYYRGEDPAEIGLGSSTNYAGALAKAKTILDEDNDVDRSDAKKVVVFVSDGEPNAGGSRNPYVSDLKAGMNAAGEITADYFYAIGVGGDVSNMNSISDAAVNCANHEFFTSSNSTALVEKFSSMAADFTSINCSNITITDVLSNYAELTDSAKFTVKAVNGSKTAIAEVTKADASTANGKSGTLTYSDPDPDGEKLNASFTVKYDDETKTITLTLPDALENGWVYSITTTVQPTDQARKEYAANIADGKDGYGDVKGDLETDAPGNNTSSNKPGFHTNNSATLIYTYNKGDISVDGTATYAHPVLQVPTTSLTIMKNFKNEDGTALSDEKINEILPITFTLKADGYPDRTVDLDTSNYQNGATVSNLPVGVTYTIEEDQSDAEWEGHSLVVSVDENHQAETEGKAEITLVKNATTNKATFTNTYTPNEVTLTINKQICGLMGDTTSTTPFSFTLQLQDTATGTSVNKGQLTYQIDGGQDQSATYTTASNGYTIQIQANQTATIKVPYGVYVSITETEQDGYEAYWRIGDAPSSAPANPDNNSSEGLKSQGFTDGNIVPAAQLLMTSEQHVYFMNFRDVVTPTGLESNHTTPYTLMVTAAGIAGLALIGGIVVRRRRRRME